MLMNRPAGRTGGNVKANRVSDPNNISGGVLHFFNRY